MSMIYEPRSKLGAVHVKEVNPDFIDGKLTINACDWIIAELLRLYHIRDPNEVSDLISKIVKEHIPIIQKIGNEKFVTMNVECKEEIMIRLADSESGLTRKELGEVMKMHFDPVTITRAIKKLSSKSERSIFLTKDKKYVISEPARKSIAKRIIELSNNSA